MFKHRLFSNALFAGKGGIFFLGILLGAGFTSCKPKALLAPDGNLIARPSVLDLGGINEGESKEGEILLRNNRCHAIRIGKIIPSCGCTRAKVGSNLLKPGQSTSLRVQTSNRGRMGEYGVQVDLEWTDLQNGKAQKTSVITKANAIQAATFSPPNVQFSDVKAGGVSAKVPMIVRRGNSFDKWTQIRLSSTNPNLSATANSVTSDQSMIEIELDARSLAAGTFKSDLKIELLNESGKICGTHVAHVNAAIAGEFTLSPKTLYFGVVKPGAQIRKDIFIRGAKGSTPEIQDIKSIPEGSVEIGEAILQGNEWRIPLVYKSPAREGKVLGQLELKIKGGQIEHLTVPVIAFVKAG